MARKAARGDRARLGPALLVGITVALLGVWAAVFASAAGDDRTLRPAYAAAFVSLELVGIVAGLYAAARRRSHPAIRRGWLLVALAFLGLAAFGAAFGAALAGRSTIAVVVMYASRIVLTGALLGALLSFRARSRRGWDRTKFGFEMATAAGGGFMLVWYFVVGPALASPSIALSMVLFPVATLMVMFGICAVLLRGVATGMRGSLALLLAGLTLFFGRI